MFWILGDINLEGVGSVYPDVKEGLQVHKVQRGADFGVLNYIYFQKYEIEAGKQGVKGLQDRV